MNFLQIYHQRMRHNVKAFLKRRWSGRSVTFTRLTFVLLQFTSALVYWAFYPVFREAWYPVITDQTWVAYLLASLLWTPLVVFDIHRGGTLMSKTGPEIFLVIIIFVVDIERIHFNKTNSSFTTGYPLATLAWSVQLAALGLSVAICFSYIVVLCLAVVDQDDSHVWLSGVRDYPWYGKTPPAGELDPYITSQHRGVPRAWTLVIGYSRGLKIDENFDQPLKSFVYGHTPFRRMIGIEPVWLAVFRGIIAITFLAGLLAFGIEQCVWSPLMESDNAPYTLPTRPRAIPDIDFSSQSSNITVGLTAYAQNNELLPPILRDISKVVSVETVCDQGGTVPVVCFLNGLVFGSEDNSWSWNCSSESFTSGYPTYIVVTVDWSNMLKTDDHADGIPTTSVEVKLGGSISYAYFQSVDFVPVIAGKHYSAAFRYYSVLTRARDFLDIFGIAHSSLEVSYTPIVSVQRVASADITSPNISTVTFYEELGYRGELFLEEYRRHDILSGLGSTGGLYTVLDLLFGLVFGRPLLAIILGSKYISPFGVAVTLFGSQSLRRKMMGRYPHLGSADPVQRSYATSDFLHDFVLDLGGAMSKDITVDTLSESDPHLQPHASCEPEELPLERVKRGRVRRASSDEDSGHEA